MGWWALWMTFTAGLALAAYLLDAREYLVACLTVLGGLLASRIAVQFIDANIAMMVVWVAVAMLLAAQGRYGMCAFSAMSAACYYPAWTSYLAADLFGILMLLAAGAGIGGTAVRDTSDRTAEVVASSGPAGPLYFHYRRGVVPTLEKAQRVGRGRA